MKRIKIIWAFLACISYIADVSAQSALTVEASQLYASFKFTDSQSAALTSDYSGIFTGAYGLGYCFTTDNGIMLRTGAGMRKAGATMVYDDMNYSWDLQYADLKLGGGYILKTDVASPYINIAGYFAYLLRGFQTINNEDFDIKHNKTINTTDYGIFIIPGVRFTLTDTFSAFVEGSYMMGLQNLETDEGQKSTNSAFGLTLGLSITLGK